jgi:hypothetical protein
VCTALSVDGKILLESSGRKSLELGWFMHGLGEHVALQRPAATGPCEIRILPKGPPEIIRYLYPLSDLTRPDDGKILAKNESRQFLLH